MMLKKDKKRKGHREAELLIPFKEAKRLNLEPVIYWDNWTDYRDGMRRYYDDRSRFHRVFHKYKPYDIEQNNKKLKKKEIIRKIRKIKKVLVEKND